LPEPSEQHFYDLIVYTLPFKHAVNIIPDTVGYD
jgi:hypothetical protein